MFANTVFSTVYQSIACLFKSEKENRIEALEHELKVQKRLSDFLISENDSLKDTVQKLIADNEEVIEFNKLLMSI